MWAVELLPVPARILHPVPHEFLAPADKLQLFVVGEGGGFAGGPGNNHGGNAGVQLPLEQSEHHGVIYGISQKRGDKGRAGPLKKDVFHHVDPSRPIYAEMFGFAY